MYENLAGKKILILGGNPETGAVVEAANSLGVQTYVLDPNPHAPSKKSATVSIHMDAMDVNAVADVVKVNEIDGVLVGVADVLVPSYQKICEKLKLPCYANEKIMQAFSTKDGFIQHCLKYDVPVTPVYDIATSLNINYEKIQYPVIVKPVDGAAGVGMTVCKNPAELRHGLIKGLSSSLKNKVIIEKYMACDDAMSYYTFVDGKSYLSVFADRFTTKSQTGLSPVCIGSNYCSKHFNIFMEKMHPRLIRMFDALDIQNGVLCIQFFVDDNNIYAYDPGFRLQGEGFHFPLNSSNGFDQRKMLINFALTGSMFDQDFAAFNDVKLNGNYCVTLWVLLKAGVITTISGYKEIIHHRNVTHIMKRFSLGDSITEEMVGTERQVFARIYLQSKNTKDMRETVEFIHSKLKITDEFGNDMILEKYIPEFY